MKYIPRALSGVILEKIQKSNKGIVLYGARQVGKTTLLQNLLKTLAGNHLFINADRGKYHEVLSSRDLNKLKGLVSGYDIVVIDEAQRIPDIGINIKILRDELPDLKIIVTGSSSLGLASKVQEPLTGRVWTYHLYPIAAVELFEQLNDFELENDLELRLRFGSYPNIFSFENDLDRQEYLENLTSSYLYKDILELADVRNPVKIRDLLRLLAFQIGNEVSMLELGTQLGLGKDTVSRYIDLLEQSFVIFRLSGFSRNLRKEVSKMDKIYFYDLGVRNLLIDNLQPLSQRNDVGQLWENYLVVERKKLMSYQREQVSTYYWRTHTGAKLDYIEERGGSLWGYEFKYGTRKNSRPPQTWLKTYSESRYQLVNRDNYLKFVK